jgi:hypothetical protein
MTSRTRLPKSAHSWKRCAVVERAEKESLRIEPVEGNNMMVEEGNKIEAARA